MRISDWSSDVCSSDLESLAAHSATHLESHLVDVLSSEPLRLGALPVERLRQQDPRHDQRLLRDRVELGQRLLRLAGDPGAQDRKSVVSGKSVSVRVDLGGRGTIKKKNKK